MQKKNIELIRDGQPQVLITWHKPDGNGGYTPVAAEFSDNVDEVMRERILAVCNRPINVREGGASRTVRTGSSAHFLALPKLLGRLGFRTRVF